MASIEFVNKERQYADMLSDLLAQEFDVIREKEIQKSPGRFYLDGSDLKVVPDLLIKPKQFLIEQHNFPDIVIPIEIKVLQGLDLDKFEDLMFQCHTYRFSTFQAGQPKMCLYFIANHFELDCVDNAHLQYDYKLITDHRTRDFHVWRSLDAKRKIEVLFGRFGIGEILTSAGGYIIKVKRCVFFEKGVAAINCKPNILNIWVGTKGKSINGPSTASRAKMRLNRRIVLNRARLFIGSQPLKHGGAARYNPP